MLALRDGAGHARCGCHRHAARRRELVDVVPRRVPLLSVDVLADIVPHILLQLHILLAAHAFMDILLHFHEAAWLMLSSFCSTEIINVVDFGPLERSVRAGCFNRRLLQASIVLAVTLPAAAGRACRILSESFGALEASL